MSDEIIPEEQPLSELPPVSEPPAVTPEPAEPIISLPLPPAVEPPPASLPLSSVATRADEISSDDKLWALLAYVLSPVLPIIIMLMEEKKNRPFLKLHNMQALVAGIAIIVVTLVLGLIPVIGCISPLVALAGWVALIYWGVQAYNGKSVTIPVVTDFVKGRGWA